MSKNLAPKQKEVTPAFTKENPKKIERFAKSHWEGNLKTGKGTLSTESKVLDCAKFSFTTRFTQDEKGTNPEELLAAAHAGCFNMSLLSILSKKGFITKSLDTKATVIMEGLSITVIHLSISGSVDSMVAEEFAEITLEAQKICMISNILKIPVTLETKFIV
jgi:osmotically inducible protein OsmC